MNLSNLNDISADHLLTLYEITRAINSSLDFDEVLNMVMDSIMEVMKAQRGFLMVADDDALKVRAARGMDGEQLSGDHA